MGESVVTAFVLIVIQNIPLNVPPFSAEQVSPENAHLLTFSCGMFCTISNLSLVHTRLFLLNCECTNHALLNLSWVCSWKQPVLSNEVEVFYNRKQWDPLIGLKLTPDRHPLIMSHCDRPFFLLIFAQVWNVKWYYHSCIIMLREVIKNTLS